jgi:hypothetical protein
MAAEPSARRLHAAEGLVALLDVLFDGIALSLALHEPV